MFTNITLLTVSDEESGMKLLRFLECRMPEDVSKSMLHKWIRTGQVRVNKGRKSAYHILAADDVVRVPPFATLREVTAHDQKRQTLFLGADLPVAALTDEYILLAKPSGLAVQPGTGNTDSVSERLHSFYKKAAYIPAPAHRLDRHTSGLVVAGRSHAAQKYLHGLFENNLVHKEYLAWVSGEWPWNVPVLLQDILEKQQQVDGREKIVAYPGGVTARSFSGNKFEAHEKGMALSAMVRVQSIDGQAIPETLQRQDCRTASLILIRLLTGRTHQIRVQCASRGFALIGDGRYGGPKYPTLMLHAYGIRVPGPDGEPALDQCMLPAWSGIFTPDARMLASARERLDDAVAAYD